MSKTDIFLFRHLYTDGGEDADGKKLTYTGNPPLRMEEGFFNRMSTLSEHKNAQISEWHENLAVESFYEQFKEQYGLIDKLYLDVSQMRLVSTAMKMFKLVKKINREVDFFQELEEINAIKRTIDTNIDENSSKTQSDNIKVFQKTEAINLYYKGVTFDSRLRDILTYPSSEAGKPRDEVRLRHLQDTISHEEAERIYLFAKEILLPRYINHTTSEENHTIGIVGNGLVLNALVSCMLGKELKGMTRDDIRNSLPTIDRGGCFHVGLNSEGSKVFSTIEMEGGFDKLPKEWSTRRLIETPFIPNVLLETHKQPSKERF